MAEFLSMEPSAYRVIGSRFVVESRIQRDGSIKWVVSSGGQSCLNTYGEMEYEPFPSSRTDEFLERTRFSSPGEALEELQKHWPKLKRLYREITCQQQ